jgi:hypothetical protein
MNDFLGDKTDFDTHYAAIWGAVEWPEGALVTVCAQPGHPEKGQRGTFRTVGYASAVDGDAIWALIAPAASLGQNVWLSVAGYQSSLAAGSGRGRKADILGLPAIIVDLDIASGVHAVGDRNPTRAEAEAWIKEAPEPTVTIFSGGGFHLWYALDELIIPGSEDCDNLLSRHKALWLSFGQRDNRNVDAGVLADVSRILRPAATWNSNQQARVELISADGPRYTAASLSALLPELTAPVPRAVAAPSARQLVPRTGPIVSSTFSLERVGDRFSVAVPASTLAIEVFDADVDPQGGLVFPRDDGSYAPDANARLFDDDDGVQRMTIFGNRVQAAFALDHNASWSSFDLLAYGVGGHKVAARLVGSAERAGSWDLSFYGTARAALRPMIASAFGIHETGRDESLTPVSRTGDKWEPTHVKAAVAGAATITTPQAGVPLVYNIDADIAVPMEHLRVAPMASPVDDDSRLAALLESAPDPSLPTLPTVIPVAPAMTVAAAVAGRLPASFELDDDDLVVHIWNDSKPKFRHGIYRMIHFQDANKVWQTREEKITSWVAFKAAQKEVMTVDANGRRIRATDADVTVTIATSDGRVKTMDGFSVKEAHSPREVLDRLNVGVQLPVNEVEVKRVANVIRSLGATDGGTTNLEQFGTMGWLKGDEGRWVYLAAGGSVGADGAATGYEVGPPPNSEAGSQLEAQLAYGWKNIAQGRADLRCAAEAVPAFLAITPKNPAAFAMLGLILAAPLALAERTSVFVVSPPDAGKTHLLRALQAFLTGSAFLSTWTGGSLLTASALGAGISARWARHGVSVFDDFRVPDDKKKADVIALAVAAVLQASYGGADSGVKSTVDGGLKAITSSETCSLISGEALPTGGTGVLSRTIAIELAVGGVEINPRGSSRLDVSRTEHADGAHAIYGAYLQFLAQRLDLAGSLVNFRAENEGVRTAHTPVSGRSASNASVIGAGWAMFREFAEEAGFADLLPSVDSVASYVGELAGANAELVSAANPAQILINSARDMVAASNGHIALHDSSRPQRTLALKLGWKWVTKYGDTGLYETSGFEVGVLSADHKWVCIRRQAISELKRRSQMNIPEGQVDAGFIPLVMEGTTPGAKVGRFFGDSRPRGYLVPASMFDLDNDE